MNKVSRIVHYISTLLLIGMLCLGALPATVISETITATSQSEGTVASEVEAKTIDTSNILEQSSELPGESVTENTTLLEERAAASSEAEAEPTTESSEAAVTAISQEEKETKALVSDKTYGLREYVKINDWVIYTDLDDPVSLTTPAVIGQAYSFSFDWELDLKGANLKNGDFFVLPLPENESWGFWSAVAGPDTNIELEKEDGTKVTVGTWKVVVVDDGTERQQPCIRAEFNEEAEAQVIQQITGVKFTMPAGTLKNETVKGGVQKVVFGKVSKNVTFEQMKQELNAGWDYKWASRTGKNNIIYNIGVGRATPLELTGDSVDFDVNKTDGFYLNGKATGKYAWGQHVTNVNDVYVEDKLPAGVSLEELTISAVTHIPIGLTATNRTSQSGGLVQRDRASEAYVLKDYGNGPIYHVAGGNEAILDPLSPASSFRVITQAAGETEAAFRNKVKSAPYQYGVYTDKNGVQTVMAYFGDVGTKGSGSSKLITYHDLTREEYSDEARTFIRKRDGKSIKVPKFAEDAADYCIANNFYSNEDRAMLEEYFTLTYGKENAVKGQAVSFNIDLNLRYPPNADLASEKSNTAQLHYQSTLYQHGKEENKKPYYNVTWQAKMGDPYGKISINTRGLLLIKFDSKTNQEMNGVKFKLQKLVGGQWVDQGDHTTGDVEVPSKSGGVEKLSGGIYVTGLGDGKYRFVEHQGTGEDQYFYPEGYDQQKSADFKNGYIVSGEYTINGSVPPPHQFVSNTPVETAPYIVEHWLLKDGTDLDINDPKNYTMHPVVDNVDGKIRKALGSTYTAKERKSIPGYSYKAGVTPEKKSGKITAITDPNAHYNENGQLVLRLYYTKDPGNMPFTIRKLTTNGKPMPSYDINGNSLGEGKQVGFEVYRYKNSGWGLSGDNHPGNANPLEKPHLYDKMTVDNSGTSLTPIYTDYKGRLQIDLPLSEGIDRYTYCIVETETYGNYKRSGGWWVVYSRWESVEGGLAIIDGVWGSGGATPTENGNGVHSIFNNPSGNTVSLYKGDEAGKPMPSDDNDPTKQVIFDLYRLKDTKTVPKDKIEEKIAEGLFNSQGELLGHWQLVGERRTDSQGKIFEEYVESSEAKTVFALVERKTYTGYELPDQKGYWVVSTNIELDPAHYINRVDFYYPNGTGGYEALEPDDKRNPGVFGPDDSENKTGYYMLKNHPSEPLEFTFTKENADEEPLGEVEFELYQGRFGEKLITEGENSNVQPGTANSYWQDDPLKLTSAATGTRKGQVKMTLGQGTYLLVETKPFEGYQLPDGYWILQVDLTTDDPEKRLTITAVGSPPAWRIDKKTNDYKYYLPNFRKYVMPKAGSSGMIHSLILGILVMALGVSYYLNPQVQWEQVLSRRKKQK